MRKEKKLDINNIFYAVIGVATLMVAIMGATFAYFSATKEVNNVIIGNMATINFDVTVDKVNDADVQKGGLIPMSNNMMEQALTSANGVCIDDNGNAVCQVYKITINNTSSSSMFVDGYVTLANGSGVPKDLPTGFTYGSAPATTMRWAQAFCTTENGGKASNCSTSNNSGAYSTLRNSDAAVGFSALGGTSTKTDGANKAEIKTDKTAVTGNVTINTNTYEIINTNYIRLSKHSGTSYDKTDDITSALVYNQYLAANDNNTVNNTGTSSGTYTDSQVYYIVVWLSENGLDQTAGATDAATATNDFFTGTVTFVTAQGSEVTAAFSGLAKVTPNTVQ